MKRLWFFIAVTALIVASCSPYRYHTTKKQGADFTQYRTYAWLTPVDSLSKSYFDNDIARENILDAANRELESRGLVYSKDNPDLLFRYIAIVNNKSRPIYAPVGGFGPWGMGWGGMWGMNPWMWGPGWGMGMGWGGWHRPVGDERYRAGHIIIEARDRATDAVIWQARGTGDVRTPEKAINNLPKVVAGIIDQYPVSPKKR